MKLEELLNAADDETWFRIKEPHGEIHEIWVADYIGGHEETLEELRPLLGCEFDDRFRIERHKDPEEGKTVPMVCVDLYERHLGDEEFTKWFVESVVPRMDEAFRHDSAVLFTELLHISDFVTSPKRPYSYRNMASVIAAWMHEIITGGWNLDFSRFIEKLEAGKENYWATHEDTFDLLPKG